MDNWIGLDIGGANVKCATTGQIARSIPFQLWQHRSNLALTLSEILSEFQNVNGIAVAMTGELADCFQSKKEGVEFIVNALESVVDDRRIVFYQTNGDFVDSEMARTNWLETAAANWHALASFAARLLPQQSGYLIDIGSTTTDIIPISNGVPVSSGLTDVQRLISRELVYAGVRRTPVSSLVDRVELLDGTATIAREFFATSADAFIWLNELPETSSHHSMADGRKPTRAACRQRLARTVCADSNELNESEVRSIALAVRKRMIDEIALAIHQVVEKQNDLPLHFVVSGEGSWLADEILRMNFDGLIFRLDRTVGPSVAECAPAYALATLAAELLRHREKNVERISSH